MIFIMFVSDFFKIILLKELFLASKRKTILRVRLL